LNEHPKAPGALLESRESSRREQFLFFLLVAAVAVPTWLVEFFPSQDGAIHLHILHLLTTYSALEGSIVQQYFIPNARIEPNMGFYALAYPLALFFDVKTSARLFLTMLAFIFCYGVRYAVGTIDRRNTYLAYLAIPATYSHFVHMGFFNFALGVGVFIPALAFAINIYHSTRRGRFPAIMLVALVLAYVHLFAFVMFAIAIAGYAFIYELSRAPKIFSIRTPVMLLRGPLTFLALALVPASGVFLVFTGEHGITSSGDEPILKQLLRLMSLRFLYSFDRVEDYLRGSAIIVLLLLITICSLGRSWRGRKDSGELLARATILLALLAVYFLTPISTAKVPIAPRVLPFFFVAFLFFLALFSVPIRLRVAVISSCVVLVAADVILRSTYYRAINAEIRAFLAVGQPIEQESLILPINMRMERIGSKDIQLVYRRPAFLEHIGAYLAIERNSIYLQSTLMSPTFFPYFPFQFRRELDPFAFLGPGIFRDDPPVNFEAFAQAAGRRIDYLIVTGSSDFHDTLTTAGAEELSDVRRELSTRYEHMRVSENGRHHLYVLRDSQPPER
jgi:hypothetical protein